jgi:hypothetical protein
MTEKTEKMEISSMTDTSGEIKTFEDRRAEWIENLQVGGGSYCRPVTTRPMTSRASAARTASTVSSSAPCSCATQSEYESLEGSSPPPRYPSPLPQETVDPRN